MNPRKLSTHFLRRRAEDRRRQIMRWQLESSQAAGWSSARKRLYELQIRDSDRIYVQKRGKWDARFDVMVEERDEAS